MTAVGARYRALDEQQTPRSIDAYHFERLHGPLDVAVLARHAFAGKYAAGILRHADRARRVVRERVTVRGAIGAKVVTLNHARESASLGRASHIDQLPDGERFNADRL